MTPSNLLSHLASEDPKLKYASVPQVGGPPESPALLGDTAKNESDQDIIITGYGKPTKPATKVILLENPPLLATLPPKVARDMMYKGAMFILCQKLYYRKCLG